MPVIKSAKKKLRQDIKREKSNDHIREFLKRALKEAKKNPTTANISQGVKALDKAAKKKIIHGNKAARLKSGLSKLTPSKKSSPVPKKPATKKKK